MKRLLFIIAFCTQVVACAPSVHAGGIGIVDVARLRDHWSKFKADDAELAAQSRALRESSAPPAELERRRTALRMRYLRMQDDVTGDVRRASDAVAKARGLTLVLTQESVGYGGVDITADVERELHITESGKQTP